MDRHHHSNNNDKNIILTSSQNSFSSTVTPTVMKVMKRIQWTSSKDALSLVISILKSKPLIGANKKYSTSSHIIEFVSNIIVQAVIESLYDDGTVGRSGLKCNVRYVTIEGPSLAKSELFLGVLLDLPDTPQLIPLEHTIEKKNQSTRDIRDAAAAADDDELIISVALFDISLDLPSVAMNKNTQTEGVKYMFSQTEDIITYDFHLIEKFVQYLKKMKIGLVCSQKTIHSHIKQLLEKNGISVITRLSRIHINAVQQVSGCLVISDFNIWNLLNGKVSSTLDDQRSELNENFIFKLGMLYKPVLRTILSENFVVLKHPPTRQLMQKFASNFLNNNKFHNDSKITNDKRLFDSNRWVDIVCERRKVVSTLIVCGEDLHTMKESKQVIEGAVLALTNCFTTPYILKGAGYWEVYAINEVKFKLRSLRELFRSSHKTTQQQQQQQASAVPASVSRACDFENDHGHRLFRRGVELFIECFETTSKIRCGLSQWKRVQATTMAKTTAIGARVGPHPINNGHIDHHISISEPFHQEGTFDTDSFTTQFATTYKGHVDSYAASISALESAVETANCMIRIQHTV